MVALTFDAGANADAVTSILGTLSRDNVPATFFLTGNFVRDFPAAARAIAAGGFRIGDHTITHPYLTQLGDAAVRNEILGGAQQISAVTGKNPAPLFRFPYGDADARTIAIANQAGYVPVRWTVDTLGWEGTAGHISAAVVAAASAGRAPARRDRPHARRLQPRRSHHVRRQCPPAGNQRTSGARLHVRHHRRADRLTLPGWREQPPGERQALVTSSGCRT